MRNRKKLVFKIRKNSITTTSLLIPLLLLNSKNIEARELDENKEQINSQDEVATNVMMLEEEPILVNHISSELLDADKAVQYLTIFDYFETVVDATVIQKLDETYSTLKINNLDILFTEALINHELGNYKISQENYYKLLNTEQEYLTDLVLRMLNDKAKDNIKIKELSSDDFISLEKNMNTEILMKGNESSPSESRPTIDSSDPNISSLSLAPTVKSSPQSANDLFNKAINAASATPAWNAALEMKKRFPHDNRIDEAINASGARQLTLGISNHRKGDFTKANEYYNRILREDLINESLRENTIFYQSLSLKRENIPTANDLYDEAVSSPYATPAWNAALDLKRIYPDDSRVATAINLAGRRQLILGMNSHRKKEFSKANDYYSRIINEKVTDSSLRMETMFYYEATLKKQEIRTADDLYNDAMSLPGATPAWNAALKLKEIFPGDPRVSEAINTSGNRQLILGMSSHRKSEYNKAIDYYKRILEENTISTSIREKVSVYISQALKKTSLRSADDLYNEAMTAPGATPAWNAARELKETFPSDVRISDALNTTANRQLILGMSNHRNKQYTKAIEYYERILEEERVNSSIIFNTTIYLNQSLKSQKLRTADDMFNDAIKSPGATPAWNAAQELKEVFPNDSRVNEAINKTASRLLILGKSRHSNKKFNEAIEYYNRILSENRVNSIITQETMVYLTQATDKQNLRTADMIHQDAESAIGATPAWRYARELKSLFPNDPRVRTLLNRTAQRLLILGMDSHEKNNLQNAKSYYQNILIENSIEVSIYKKAESYNYLAENNLGLTNMIVRYTNYSYNLTEATNKQMAIKNGKPQISHKGGWRDATRDEVLLNINPLNSIPSDITYALSTLRVVSTSLNVRSTPKIDNNIMQKVYKDEVYTIIDEDNGWYKIALSNGRNGWVSSGSMYVRRDTNVLQFLVLSGSSVVSTSDLNSVLSGAGVLSNQGLSYNKASTLYNVNELYLVAHSLLETGNGSSNLATGIRVSEVDGVSVAPRIVYNMYGIGATDSNPDKFGSETAYKEGWFTPEQAIIGGAEWISKNYVNKSTYKQDTLYKMRWNPDSPGSHQYATDVAWAQKQTRDLVMIASLARKHNLLLNFNIPKYN